MIRAVIFDFDGLIVDTETADLQSWQEIFREYGQELSLERWALNVGRAEGIDIAGDLRQLVGQTLDPESLRARRRARNIELAEAQPVLPGIRDRIAEARAMDVKLGVASSSRRDWVEGHLARLRLIADFHAIRCRDHPDVGVGKPDPTVYLAVLRALGVAADEAIALEDSSSGVQAAQTAGIFTVAVPNDITRRMGDAGADLTLESLASMPLAEIVRIAEGPAQTTLETLDHE